jgi:hypothetical protein
MKTEFIGELSVHRSPRELGIIGEQVPQMRDELLNKWATEDVKNLGLLSKHFGLEHGDYLGLSVKLAELVVPAFQEKPAKGRKTKWSKSVISMLVVEMENKIVKGDESKGVAWAAGLIAKVEPWSSFLETRATDIGGQSGDPQEAIRRKYFDNHDGDHAGLRSLYQGLKEAGKIELWHRLVRQTVINVNG